MPNASEDDQRVARYVNIDILEVVDARAPHLHAVLAIIGNGFTFVLSDLVTSWAVLAIGGGVEE